MAKPVLIVDDDEKVRKMLGFLFSTKGFRVTNASNGREGLEELKRERPSVVILDIMMPEMDGISFYSEMKNDRELEDIPVLVLSALPATDNIKKLVSMPAENYLTKPFKSAEVLGRAIELMQQASCNP